MSKSSNDRGFVDAMNSGLPTSTPTGAALPNGGFDEDFVKTLGGIMGHDVPPLHPGKRVEITDEEYEEALRKKQDPALLLGHTQLRSEYYQFSLDDPEQVTKLQNAVNNCLQKGWILAREEWHRTQEGNTIIAMKCLVPLPKPNKKKEE